MKESLSVKISHQGPDSLLILEGEIDVSVVDKLRLALELVVESAPDTILIDLEAVTFLSLDVAAVIEEELLQCRLNDTRVVLLTSHAVDRVLHPIAYDMAQEAAAYSVPEEIESQLRKAADGNP